MTEPKRPRGRPRKHAENRMSVSWRLPDSIRAQLIEAAIANKRSQSEEIEARLVASFDQPALIDALADRLEERQAERRAGLFTVLFPVDDLSSGGTKN